MGPATRRRMPAAQRREVILAAAEATFARSGYHAAALEDIAAAAGVSKALIYEHFESKRALHTALLGANAAEIFRRLEEGAAQGRTGAERLRNGIDAFLAFVEDNREAWRALSRDAADPVVAEVASHLQERATAVVGALLAAGGAEDGQRAEIRAQLLSGAVQALATWWDGHRDVPRAVLVERAMELFRPAVERAPAGSPAR
jgi:AcrR family transcriptional regulator